MSKHSVQAQCPSTVSKHGARCGPLTWPLRLSASGLVDQRASRPAGASRVLSQRQATPQAGHAPGGPKLRGTTKG